MDRSRERLLAGCILVFSLLVIVPGAARGATFCVSTAPDLQSALTTAAFNGENDVVQVVQGTYEGNFVYASTEPFNNLAIEGGYVTGCGSRVVDPTNTVLDGLGAGTVLALTTDWPAEFEVDGLTMQNGNIGLFVRTDVSIVLTNSTVQGNGTGVDIANAAVVTLTDNTVDNNAGNGIVLSPSGDATLTGNIISNNVCHCIYGGGIYVGSGATVVLNDNTISNNSSDWDGGGMYVNNVGAVVLNHNTISNNSSGDGGGLYLQYGGNVTLTDNDFFDNVSGQFGGAVRCEHSNEVTLTSNTFVNNTAGRNGGGFDGYDYDVLTFTGNTFDHNTAGDVGGAFSFGDATTAILTNNVISRNLADSGGGASLGDSGEITLTNNTVTGNQAAVADGGGIRMIYGSDAAIGNVYNNIIWGNAAFGTADDLYIDNDADGNFTPSTVNLMYNDFDQSADGIYIKIPFPIHGSNLNNEDPQFVNAAGGDYHLQAISPVVNVGDNLAPEIPSTDKDGATRIISGVVDLGAYEYLNPLDVIDLVVSSLSGRRLGLIGGRVPVSAQVENLFPAAAGAFRLGFYFSTDAEISTGDTFSGSFCEFSGLGGGSTDSCALNVDIPPGLTPGTYYLGAVVDDLDQVDEAYEFNNTRAADTGTTDLAATCILDVRLDYTGGTLTIDFDLGTLQPVQWGVWLVSQLGINPLWSAPLPAIDPPVSFPVPIPGFPSLGKIGILSTLTAPTGGLLCYDFKIVDTGGAGATAQQLQEMVRQKGVPLGKP